MPQLTASEIAQLLREMGDRLALEGGNPFRARAYHRAAENLALSTLPLDQLIQEERLTEIPCVGESLARVITQLHETGHYSSLETKRSETPQGMLDMLRIPGLKPDRIKKLYEELGIKSLAELEEAAKSDRLTSAKGFGPAFQAKVLQGIEMSRRPQGRHLHRARAAINYAMAELERTHPYLTCITPAGEFRRGCELINTMALVAINPRLNRDHDTITAGDSLTVHVTSPQRYGITLLLATGSDQHIEALRAVAKQKGLILDGDGVRKGNRLLASKREEDIYDALDLPFIAPELRESGKEVVLALNGELPELVTDTDIRGILHAHTTESDGGDTLEDMAQATKDRGYAYLGLTDHSQTAHYAGGLKPAEVLTQQQHIDTLNKRFGSRFRIFKGIESDILPDGSLDYPDEILDSFDMVIASIHSQFRKDKAEQTERILKAIADPHTTILGHVTGRQLMRRPGYEVDMEKILKACAKHGVAIEINANPWRLDLDWRWCARGLELGCLFSINPDAHSTDEIDNVGWGVLMARKGAVPKDRVLNTLNLDQFAAHLAQRNTTLTSSARSIAAKPDRMDEHS
ncbi:MAG: DNA polymerase/3'-5' exonuclease PolX [Nitrospira sp. SG-bin1]|nr:MAG: DNA polymerase/3'-5' exonuclease PolX [Nitrospira sp. SG-bin1]